MDKTPILVTKARDSILYIYPDYTYRYDHWGQRGDMGNGYCSRWRVTEDGDVHHKHSFEGQRNWTKSLNVDFIESMRKADKLIKDIDKALLFEDI